CFFFSSRRRHTRSKRDWSSDVCSSDLGVGAALISGGPGAIFWMWVTAFFGMMTSYAENLLGLRYRQYRAGSWHGGPMYYLSAGRSEERRVGKECRAGGGGVRLQRQGGE